MVKVINNFFSLEIIWGVMTTTFRSLKVCGMKDLRFFIFLAEPHPIGGFNGRKCQLDILNKFLVERTVQKQNELISLFFTCVTPNMSSPLPIINQNPIYLSRLIPSLHPSINSSLTTQIVLIPFNLSG